MDAKGASYRVLMFPWLAHGHIYPFLELAKNLSNRNFHIYFCSTPINLDSITTSLNNKDFSIQFVELDLQSSPELPPHYHTTKNIPPHLMPLLIQAFQKSAPRFSDIIASIKPDLLIYDGFQPWSAKIAASQGIPPVLFCTSGATAVSFFHHMHTHVTFDTFPYDAIRLEEHEKRVVLAVGESIKIDDQGEGFAFGIFQLSHDIVIIKSCRGIEGTYMDYLSKLCHKRIVPTGPLVTYNEDQETAGSEILNWLSKKSERSTLYISFGSENYLSQGQIGEIARGLEVSGVNFIWVVRSPLGSESSVEEALSDGFLERSEERGLVVQKWAPQAAILAHSSVGGFMSHCGWSSVMESVFFGVPVVAMPLKLDQPPNARLVASAGIGVEVVRDENGDFDGKGVAKAINKVFEEEREGLRRKVRKMSEKMKMEEEEAMDEVVGELARICMKN